MKESAFTGQKWLIGDAVHELVSKAGMQNEIGLQLFDFKTILQCMCQNELGGNDPLKTLYYWLSAEFYLPIERTMIGHITKSDRWFHQAGDAFAVIGFYPSVTPKSRWKGNYTILAEHRGGKRCLGKKTVNWVLPGIVIALRILKVKFLHFALILF